MALLAVAMELGAGLALHRAWRTAQNSGEDWQELRKELRTLRGQMVALATEMMLLQNEPAIFAARFWRNFYHAMLTHTVRNAMAKLLLGFLILLLPGLHGYVDAQEQTAIVAAIDLSQSVAGAGPDSRSDFEKNVAGVTGLLAKLAVASGNPVPYTGPNSTAALLFMDAAISPVSPKIIGGSLGQNAEIPIQ